MSDTAHPEQTGEGLTFWDHLDELRAVIIKALVVTTVAAAVAFCLKDELFAVVLATIVTRTEYWPYVTAFVAVAVFFLDRRIFLKTDYVLLLTFLCFFVFSASITENAAIANVLKDAVSEHEYWWGILLSQLISNVPASIQVNPLPRS